MPQTITLNLPDSVIQTLQRKAQATRQPVESLMLAALESALPSQENLPVAIEPHLTETEAPPTNTTSPNGAGAEASHTEAQRQFEREEAAYWQQRDELLKLYPGQCVAIVGGVVVAVGKQMNHVAAEAWRKTGSGVMYVGRVGAEDLVLRVRQVTLGYYERAYVPPMPMLTATVSNLPQAAATDTTFVVDTGADLTVLRHAIADQIAVWSAPGGHSFVSGIGGKPSLRQLYNALIQFDGRSVLVMADCRDDVDEDILGRDVINEFAFTCCAKREQVQFEWVEGAVT